MRNLEDKTIEKITFEMINNIQRGETIKIDEELDLYCYTDGYTVGEEEDYEEPKHIVLTKEDEEIYCVMTDESNVVFYEL